MKTLAALTLLAASAMAAAADAYEVKIAGLPDRFVSGGQGGVMSVSATRLAPECSRIRALMLITLPGIDYGHLKVEVKTERGWEISPISRAGDNTMRAEDNWIDVNFLCQGQTRALQHRITFLPGAPAGTALIDVVISSHGDSAEAGRGKATRPVGASPAQSARPKTSPTAAAPMAQPSTEEDGRAVGRATRAFAEAHPRPVSNVVVFAGGGGLAAVLVVAGLLLFVRRRVAR